MKLLNALEAARHALVLSHGLTATDRNDLIKLTPDLAWEIDNSKEIALIDELIKEELVDKRAAAEDCLKEQLAALGMQIIRVAANDSARLSKELEEIFFSIRSKHLSAQANIRRRIQEEKPEPLNKLQA